VANQFLFADWITMESLRILTNKLVMPQFFNTDYSRDFTKEYPIGETLRVKLPQRFTVRDGLGYSPQAINRINTTITVNQIFGVDFEWDSAEKALNMERGEDQVRSQYIEPIMAQLAQEIDSRCIQYAYQNTNNIVGVLGTNPTTITTFQQARQRLIEKACPAGGEKGMLIAPAINTALVPALASTFNPTSEISRQYKEGSIGKLSGFDWYESPAIFKHTAGTWASTVSVKGANQTGSSLTINATVGDTFNVGDVFSIANVKAVNPSTRRVIDNTNNAQFVVTQALTAAGGGVDVIQISPSIFGPGSQYQNVDALAVDAAVMTLFPGTTGPNGLAGSQNLAITRDAFALVGVALELPKKVEVSSQTRDPESGIPLRFIRAWDNIQSKMTNRFDVLLGFGNLYPDNCSVRVLGA
jgi:coat protein Gp5